MVTDSITVNTFPENIQSEDTLPEDVLPEEVLHEVVVTESKGALSKRDALGSRAINAEGLGASLRTLGEVDAIGFLKLLPGISAGSDYSSGISMQGTAYSQTLYRIDGAPVFFPYHLLGIFSTFNVNQLPEISFSRNINDRSVPTRIGGVVDFHTRDSDRGSVNLGLTSSSLSLARILSEKFSVSAGARVSYLNLFYPSLLKTEATTTRYDFYDLNFSCSYRFDNANTIKLTGFRNSDKLGNRDNHYASDIGLRWNNDLLTLNWTHTGSIDISQNLYYSDYGSRMSVELPQLGINMPSSLKQIGYHGQTVFFADPQKRISLLIGWAFENSWVRAQSARSYGFGFDRDNSQELLMATESRIFAQSRWTISSGVDFYGGLRGILYHCGSHHTHLTHNNCGSYHNLGVDPMVGVRVQHDRLGTFDLNANVNHQYLHQVGLSDIGMASNFWIASTRKALPTTAYSLTLNYTRKLFDSEFELEAEVYGKRIIHDNEYFGNILDLLQDNYDPYNLLISSNGYNYGFDLMFRKDYGKIKGWISYSWGAAVRKYKDYKDPSAISDIYVNAATSPGHNFDLLFRYSPNKRWELAATFNLHSGRAVTPINALYLIGENIITEYGLRNSSRLPLYHRLDLSASLNFGSFYKGKGRHYLNFSVRNVYGHHNVEMIKYSFNQNTGEFKQRYVGNLYKIFPSLSYTIEF